MYYKFGSNSGEDIANKIDTDNIEIILNEKFQLDGVGEYDERVDIMRKFIKNKREFEEFTLGLDLEFSELIDSLVRLYPYKLFNHHLIKFVKENYLNE